MERQKSVHQALSLDDLNNDPDYNPALLPPRTRADVVQARPAGGTPEEVENANPGLAAAIPATVGQSGPAPADTAAQVAEHIQDAYDIPTSDASKVISGSPVSKEAGSGPAAAAAAGQPAVAGGGLRVGDGSGMEVPELAVLSSEP